MNCPTNYLIFVLSFRQTQTHMNWSFFICKNHYLLLFTFFRENLSRKSSVYKCVCFFLVIPTLFILFFGITSNLACLVFVPMACLAMSLRWLTTPTEIKIRHSQCICENALLSASPYSSLFAALLRIHFENKPLYI